MPELSIYQEAAVATAAVLVVVLLVQRRRRAGLAAAAAGTTSSGPAGTPGSGAPSAGFFRLRRKGDSPDGAPRGRRRRRLAQEAAAATGAAPVELPASEQEAIAPVAPVEPFVPAAPVVDPAAAEQPTGEIPIVTIDQAIEPASQEDGEDFVAQPGWPAPGELATGYDPDAFDPVPEPGSEVEEAEADSEADQPEPVEDDHPGADDEILILPDDDPVEQPQVTVDVESLEWDAMDDGGFDPATGWGADEPEAPAWEEGDDETTAWSFDAESGDGAPEAVPSFDAEPEAVEAEEPVDEHEVEHEAPEVDWDEVPSPWAAPAEAVVEEAPEDRAPPVGLLDYELPPLDADSAPDEPAATAHPVGPLVLDLGSIGRAGEAIELVIEQGRAGEGIRLRLSSHDEVEAVHEPESDGTPLSTRERQAFDELDELLQGMLRLPEADAADEPEAAAEPAFDAEPEAEVEPEILDVPFLTGGPVAFAAPAEADGEKPFEPHGDGPQNGHHDEANGHHANGHDAVKADDPHDPAAILAEIRARLALLDAPGAERESDGAAAGLS